MRSEISLNAGMSQSSSLRFLPVPAATRRRDLAASRYQLDVVAAAAAAAADDDAAVSCSIQWGQIERNIGDTEGSTGKARLLRLLL